MSGFTAEQVAVIYERQGRRVPETLRTDSGSGTQGVGDTAPTVARQQRLRHNAGEMNRLERRFLEEHILPAERAAEIVWWGFEQMKLRLATRTFYTPDFWSILRNGKQVIDEIKGHWEDDARVKIKVAAEQFPYLHFRAWMWTKKDGWKVEDIH